MGLQSQFRLRACWTVCFIRSLFYSAVNQLLDNFVENELYLGFRDFFNTTRKDCVWRDAIKDQKLCTEEVSIWLYSNGSQELVRKQNPIFYRSLPPRCHFIQTYRKLLSFVMHKTFCGSHAPLAFACIMLNGAVFFLFARIQTTTTTKIVVIKIISNAMEEASYSTWLLFLIPKNPICWKLFQSMPGVFRIHITVCFQTLYLIVIPSFYASEPR